MSVPYDSTVTCPCDGVPEMDLTADDFADPACPFSTNCDDAEESDTPDDGTEDTLTAGEFIVQDPYEGDLVLSWDAQGLISTVNGTVAGGVLLCSIYWGPVIGWVRRHIRIPKMRHYTPPQKRYRMKRKISVAPPPSTFVF